MTYENDNGESLDKCLCCGTRFEQGRRAPSPREQRLERYKRALWYLMRWRQNDDAPTIAREVDVFMREIEFVEPDDKNTSLWWSKSAHDFAKSMEADRRNKEQEK